MWFKCRVCDEKDKRIADLKEQLDTQAKLLRSVVAPQYATAVNMEMNRALEGAGTAQIDMNEEQQAEAGVIERQAIALLTGTYN